jgi:hypothetical protein
MFFPSSLTSNERGLNDGSEPIISPLKMVFPFEAAGPARRFPPINGTSKLVINASLKILVEWADASMLGIVVSVIKAW